MLTGGDVRVIGVRRVFGDRECELDKEGEGEQGWGMENTNLFAKQGGKVEVEEGLEFMPKFAADGLIPALAMDAVTREPLMLAYMNEESLRRTLEIGEAVYCHSGRESCFYRKVVAGGGGVKLEWVEAGKTFDPAAVYGKG